MKIDQFIACLLIVALILILIAIFDPDIIYHFLAPSIHPSDLVGLENKIRQKQAIKNYQPDKYAILIRGSNEERFVAETSIAYQVLLENGFKPENIYVLADVKKRKEIYFHPIDDVATKKNLEILMNHLCDIVDERDLLFVYLVDHGFRKTSASIFNLKGKNISEIELERYLSEIHPQRGILLFSFCYSGGFAERLGKGDYIAIADTTAEDIGRSKQGDSFDGWFFRALSSRSRDKADFNQDGRISLQEAFDYAKQNHYATRKNQQKPTPIIKSRFSLTEIFIDG